MILISWHGVRVVRDGRVVEEYIFPDDKIVEIIDSLMRGDLKPLRFITEKYPQEEIVFRGECEDMEKMNEVAIALARYRMRKMLGKDYILEQVLALYDDVVSTINILSERQMEIQKIEDISGEKMEESAVLRAEISRLLDMREYLAGRIEDYVKALAPNLGELLGPLLAARLIHYAGGLERLAKMPSSTIQMLGAENAFFRHLKKGTPCPKHGIIFQFPEIRNSPKKLRGKIARALASKIAIAARVDFYQGKFVGDKLKVEFENRVGEIKNDFARKRQ